MKPFSLKSPIGSFLCALLILPGAAVTTALANSPGGGTGTGPAITLVDNGNGTLTMGNGIVSILCNVSGAELPQINYTYNNGGGIVTNQMLNGGTDGGKFYWEEGGFGTSNFTETASVSVPTYGE
ncbi:MAG: hypothetical protein ABSF38_04845, partial [Verrucomicrobiota bacterium]